MGIKMKTEKILIEIPKAKPKQMEAIRQDAIDKILAENAHKFMNGEMDALIINTNVKPQKLTALQKVLNFFAKIFNKK